MGNCIKSSCFSCFMPRNEQNQFLLPPSIYQQHHGSNTQMYSITDPFSSDQNNIPDQTMTRITQLCEIAQRYQITKKKLEFSSDKNQTTPLALQNQRSNEERLNQNLGSQIKIQQKRNQIQQGRNTSLVSKSGNRQNKNSEIFLGNESPKEQEFNQKLDSKKQNLPLINSLNSLYQDNCSRNSDIANLPQFWLLLQNLISQSNSNYYSLEQNIPLPIDSHDQLKRVIYALVNWQKTSKSTTAFKTQGQDSQSQKPSQKDSLFKNEMQQRDIIKLSTKQSETIQVLKLLSENVDKILSNQNQQKQDRKLHNQVLNQYFEEKRTQNQVNNQLRQKVNSLQNKNQSIKQQQYDMKKSLENNTRIINNMKSKNKQTYSQETTQQLNFYRDKCCMQTSTKKIFTCQTNGNSQNCNCILNQFIPQQKQRVQSRCFQEQYFQSLPITNQQKEVQQQVTSILHQLQEIDKEKETQTCKFSIIGQDSHLNQREQKTKNNQTIKSYPETDNFKEFQKQSFQNSRVEKQSLEVLTNQQGKKFMKLIIKVYSIQIESTASAQQQRYQHQIGKLSQIHSLHHQLQESILSDQLIQQLNSTNDKTTKQKPFQIRRWRSHDNFSRKQFLESSKCRRCRSLDSDPSEQFSRKQYNNNSHQSNLKSFSQKIKIQNQNSGVVNQKQQTDGDSVLSAYSIFLTVNVLESLQQFPQEIVVFNSNLVNILSANAFLSNGNQQIKTQQMQESINQSNDQTISMKQIRQANQSEQIIDFTKKQNLQKSVQYFQHNNSECQDKLQNSDFSFELQNVQDHSIQKILSHLSIQDKNSQIPQICQQFSRRNHQNGVIHKSKLANLDQQSNSRSELSLKKQIKLASQHQLSDKRTLINKNKNNSKSSKYKKFVQKRNAHIYFNNQFNRTDSMIKSDYLMNKICNSVNNRFMSNADDLTSYANFMDNFKQMNYADYIFHGMGNANCLTGMDGSTTHINLIRNNFVYQGVKRQNINQIILKGLQWCKLNKNSTSSQLQRNLTKIYQHKTKIQDQLSNYGNDNQKYCQTQQFQKQFLRYGQCKSQRQHENNLKCQKKQKIQEQKCQAKQKLQNEVNARWLVKGADTFQMRINQKEQLISKCKTTLKTVLLNGIKQKFHPPANCDVLRLQSIPKQGSNEVLINQKQEIIDLTEKTEIT